MTETEARQVVLLQAHEGEGGRHWSADDRQWATRQAVAVVGEDAAPERFVVARAALALQRLLPRDASARRWLERRAWHPAWVWLGALLGFITGVAVDRLGPPEHVNLLAPAVWAVVLWNLCVYLASAVRWRGGVGGRIGPWLARRGRGADLRASLLWGQAAAPLSMKRAALVLHVAAAALALGLVAGLYLRGLVLDYRAGWQSTFLDAPAVQALLDTLLAPASVITGIAVPAVAALRVGPGAPAQATAAPWIHLYATTLVLCVVLPRLAFAWWSALRAGALSRRFPLALDTPYFVGLHPLMRPGVSRVVRLSWVAPPASGPVTLLGHTVAAERAEALTLLRSDEGDELQLLPSTPAREVTAPAPWWKPWRTPAEPPRVQADAVLVLTATAGAEPAELPALDLPVLALRDADSAAPPALALRRLADGWLPDGLLLQALSQLLPGDTRLPRLAAAWAARQRALMQAGVDDMAETLARVASMREPVAEATSGLLGGARAESEAAREAARRELLAALERELGDHHARLLTLLGRTDGGRIDTTVPGAESALRGRVGEGRAAVVGGLLSGAAAGFKADVLSGGLTMGAGALAGGLLGALGAAGAARGFNLLRGTDRSHLTWDEPAMQAITSALLQRWAAMFTALPLDAVHDEINAAVDDRWGELWRAMSTRAGAPPEARHKSADALRTALATVLREALGEPSTAA
ncbi:MAG: DUF3482 domain-containing protein [Rhizobacter sp.]|nr:DUF3482 domain-containing protein [Rhizobacter sp.]